MADPSGGGAHTDHLAPGYGIVGQRDSGGGRVLGLNDREDPVGERRQVGVLLRGGGAWHRARLLFVQNERYGLVLTGLVLRVLRADGFVVTAHGTAQ